jgi:hypothetical protein
MKNLKRSLSSGFLSGLTGALCCVTPLVLVLLGLSSVSGAMGIASYLQQNFRWTLFIPLALVLLFTSIYLHIKRKEGSCNLKNIKKNKNYILITIIFTILTWTTLIYLLVPFLFKLLS